jgi:ribonuclease R
VVHRLIKHLIQGGTKKDTPIEYAQLSQIGEHCSSTERRADEATRDATSWLKCEYMLDKVGETFKGVITTATSFGIFIELDDIYIEGLIHISALASDYYHFDAAKHQLVGENTHKRYRVGDSIEILVSRVDLDDRKVDFVLPETDSQTAKPKKKKSKYNKRRKKR